ncbi:MAG: DUF4123 domain-containing protein [Thermoanaerobaculia bacterium]
MTRVREEVAAIVIGELWPPGMVAAGQSTYALVDAARDPRIHPALMDADCTWRCLYRGDAARRLATAAPYLVELEPEARFTRRLLHEGWGDAWGVFIHASATLDALQAHFRRLILARMPDGRTVYFRFYDPRVLRVYLPTCTANELATIFGPVDRYVLESRGGGGIVTFERGSEQLDRRARSFTAEGITESAKAIPDRQRGR